MKPQAPYYESRFIRANDPDGARALWMRSTLLLPRSGAPVADSWVMLFDPDGSGNRALKQPHPIDQSDYQYDTWTARIGATSIDDWSARGSVSGADRSAQWDLRITPGAAAPVKLLTDRGYKAKFPTAKTMVRDPLARFDGSVELDDARFEVAGWTGSVNHNWGRRHTPAYAFGQVCGFDGAPGSSLEIVTAHAAVGPVSLPAATLLVLRHDGREVAVRSVLATRHTRGEYRPFSWSFGARVDDVTVDGEITARAGRCHRAYLYRYRRRVEVLLQLRARDVPYPPVGQRNHDNRTHCYPARDVRDPGRHPHSVRPTVGLADCVGDRRHVEVVPPGLDLPVLDLEDPGDGQPYRFAVLAPHDIGALVHHQVAVADLPVHLEVDAVEVEGFHESRDELLDGLAALHGVHRHVVKDAVFCEVAGQFLGIGRRPLRAEFGDQFVG